MNKILAALLLTTAMVTMLACNGEKEDPVPPEKALTGHTYERTEERVYEYQGQEYKKTTVYRLEFDSDSTGTYTTDTYEEEENQSIVQTYDLTYSFDGASGQMKLSNYGYYPSDFTYVDDTVTLYYLRMDDEGKWIGYKFHKVK